MTVDTRNRRASALAGTLSLLIAYPAPDGVLTGVGDRRHMVGLYAMETAPAGHRTRLIPGGLTRLIPAGLTKLRPGGTTRLVPDPS